MACINQLSKIYVIDCVSILFLPGFSIWQYSWPSMQIISCLSYFNYNTLETYDLPRGLVVHLICLVGRWCIYPAKGAIGS